MLAPNRKGRGYLSRFGIKSQFNLGRVVVASPAAVTTRAARRHQLISLPAADQSSLRDPAPPPAPVLTIDVAGLLLARLFALVERKLSGKEVLFTLVIEGLLRRKRRRRVMEC